MALDRLGNTIVLAQVYLIAGPVRRIDGDTVVVVLGERGEHALRVDAGDVIQVDDAGGGGGGGGAPVGADYLVRTLHGDLTAERVVTDTATVTWDWGTAGQAKATVPAATTSVPGVVELATSAETSAGLAIQASDTRLSDARTPLAHVHAAADITTGTIAVARLPAATTSAAGISELATSAETTAGLVVQASDPRLSDVRNPKPHGASHQVDDTDPIAFGDALRLYASDSGAAAIELPYTAFGASVMAGANAAAVTALLNIFTTALKGLVPSGGSSTTYLKGNATWGPLSGGDVDSASVPLTALANVASKTVIGRTAAGSGVPTELPMTTVVDDAFGSRRLHAVYDTAELASSTTETTLISLSVPANAMGAVGGIRVVILGTILSNNGTPIYLPRVKWGTTTYWGDNFGIAASATYRQMRIEVEVRNLNATNKQALHGQFWASNAAAGSTAGIGNAGSVGEPDNLFGTGSTYPNKDTTSAQTIEVSLQMGTSDANIRFKVDYAEVVLCR